MTARKTVNIPPHVPGPVKVIVHDDTPKRVERTHGIRLLDGSWGRVSLPLDVTADEFDGFVRGLIDKRHELVHA